MAWSRAPDFGHGSREGSLMKNLAPRALCAAVLVVGLAGGPVAAHGQAGQHSPPTSSNIRTITIDAYSYIVPKHVHVGAKVNIVNKDSVAHTVTADDESFNVYVAGGATGFLTAPSHPGRYSFYCVYH